MADLMEHMNSITQKVKGAKTIENAIKLCKKLNKENSSKFPQYFKDEEKILLSFFANLAIQDESGPFMKEISEHFEMERVKVISLVPFLENLKRNGFLEKSIPHRATVQSLSNCHYFVPSDVMTSISMNKMPDPIENLKAYSTKQLIQIASKIIQEKQIGSISNEDLISRIDMLLELNSENEMVKNILKIFPSKKGGFKYGKQINEFIFLILMLDNVSRGATEISPDELLDGLDESGRDFLLILRHYDYGKHLLLEKKYLIPLKRSLKKTYQSYEFTEEGLGYFLGSEKETIISTNINLDLLNPNEIEEKQLFFEGAQSSQLTMLSKLLEGGKFEEHKIKLAKRFAGKGGIAILLHGAPGTGKTEFVHQLAKQSNRPILKIDLSNTKSMWYGESEKITKNIFASYKKSCKANKNIPILFINEADGLLSKRFQVERSIDQTSNTIQNIMLEEMEQFEGILIATTNLMVNLDPAFNRRFLMKVKFDIPSAEIREQVWKNVLPELESKQAQMLAAEFTLSPAQISNVAQKLVLKELIGEPTDNVALINLCEEENNKETKRLGFV